MVGIEELVVKGGPGFVYLGVAGPCACQTNQTNNGQLQEVIPTHPDSGVGADLLSRQ